MGNKYNQKSKRLWPLLGYIMDILKYLNEIKYIGIWASHFKVVCLIILYEKLHFFHFFFIQQIQVAMPTTILHGAPTNFRQK